MDNRFVTLLCSSITLFFVCIIPCAAQEYTVTDLGVLSTSAPVSYGMGISPSGDYITGYSYDSGWHYRMWRWTTATGMQIMDSTVRDSRGFGINDSGHISGTVNISSAAYYNGSSVVVKNTGSFQNINSVNRAAGWYYLSGKPGRAYIYNGTANTATALGVLPSAPSTTGVSLGWGINENGVVTGESNYGTKENKYHAFLWTPTTPNGTTGSMADLHSLSDFDDSNGKAINGANDVVGYCRTNTTENTKRAFRKLHDGIMELLPALPAPFYYQDSSYNASEANSINNDGIIVGTAGYLSSHTATITYAVRWVDDELDDLNHCIDLRSPWSLVEANSISSTGKIVGTGRINNETHAFLLTPITSPTVSPTPHIDSISPSGLRTRDIPTVLHITGTGFTTGSVVFCKTSSYVAVQPLVTRFVSSTQLDADFNYSDSQNILVLNPRPGGGQSNWVDFTVTPNQMPVAVNDSASTNKDIPVVIDVLKNDYDPEGDQVTIATFGSPDIFPYDNKMSQHGGILELGEINGHTGIKYTPPVGYTGQDTFYYQIKDPQGSYSLWGTVTITVNANPIVNSISPNKGNNNGSIMVTIEGELFETGATVMLAKSAESNIEATDVTVVDPEHITCSFNLEGKPAGIWDVGVTNPDGNSGKLTNGFTITEGYSISAVVNLGNYAASPEGIPVEIKLLNIAGDILRTENTTLDIVSMFHLHNVLPGIYYVAIKPSHWLRKITGPVIVTDSDVEFIIR